MDLNDFARVIRLKWVEHNPDAEVPDIGAIRRLAEVSSSDVDFCVDVLEHNRFDKFLKYINYVQKAYKTDMYFDDKTNRYYTVYVDDEGRRYINKPCARFATDGAFENGFILNPEYRLEPDLDKDLFVKNLHCQLDYLFQTGQIDEKLYNSGVSGIEILDQFGVLSVIEDEKGVIPF